MSAIRTSPANLFETQSLIGSRNALHFDNTKKHYVRCFNDGRFDVLDSITNFTFSIKINVEDFHASTNSRVSLISTITYPGSFNGFAAFIVNGSELFLTYAQNSDGSNNLKLLRYPLTGLDLTNQLIQITISQNISIKQTISGKEVVVPTVYLNQKTLNVDLASSQISGAYDDSITCATNTQLTEVGRLAVINSSFEDYTKAFVSDLLVLNTPITPNQNYAILQGLMPTDVHSNTVAFIPFNQDNGLMAFDNIEQFNYAKTTSAQALHWELTNYSFDEVGGVTQSAWYNIYTKQPEPTQVDRTALRFDPASQNYLTVPDFTPTKEKGYTTIIGFALDSNRGFDVNYDDILLSKRSSTNDKYKVVVGLPNSKGVSTLLSIPAGSGSGNTVNFNTDVSKPSFIAFQESDHVESTSPVYYYYANRKYFCNGYKVNEDGNGFNRSHGYDEIDGDLYIGVDDLQTIAGRYFNGYLFYFGIWKGFLTEAQIHKVINKGFPLSPAENEMENCQLFVDFDSVYDDNGVLKLVDRSSMAHTIILHNYSSQDFDTSSDSYKLTTLEELINPSTTV